MWDRGGRGQVVWSPLPGCEEGVIALYLRRWQTPPVFSKRESRNRNYAAFLRRWAVSRVSAKM